MELHCDIDQSYILPTSRIIADIINSKGSSLKVNVEKIDTECPDLKTEAKTHISSWLEMIPDVQSLQKEHKIQKLGLQSNPRMNSDVRYKRMLCQVNALEPMLEEINADMIQIGSDIEMMLVDDDTENLPVLPRNAFDVEEEESLKSIPEAGVDVSADPVDSKNTKDTANRSYSAPENNKTFIRTRGRTNKKLLLSSHEKAIPLSKGKVVNSWKKTCLSKKPPQTLLKEKLSQSSPTLEVLPQNKSRKQRTYHSNKKTFVCVTCNSSFDNLFEIRQHRLIHPRNFRCDLCNKVMKTKSGMKSHSFLHSKTQYYYIRESVTKVPGSHLCASGDDEYTCETCGLQFRTLSRLHSHMKVHDEYYLKCDICEKIFPTRKKLTWHKRVHNKKEKHACLLCMNVFLTQRTLHEHMNVHTGDKPFKCSKCNLSFPSKSARVNHVRRVHTGYLCCSCEICGKGFNYKNVRETHYTTCHTEEELNHYNIKIEIVKCEVCGKSIRKRYYKKHKSAHASDSYICELCGKSFKTISSLKQHGLSHLGKDERLKATGTNVCNICGRGFSSPTFLTKHVSLQHLCGQQLLQCAVCDKVFINQSTFNIHMNSHANERSYVCDMCGKSYKYEHQLRVHKKVHAGEYPYQCDKCGKGFLYRQPFEKHIVVHSGVKAYKCMHCDQRFYHEQDLRKHGKRHTGEKHFQCDFCGKKFSEKHVLKVHRRIHTGEKPLECNFCGMKFSDPSTLYKHKNNHCRKKENEDDLPLSFQMQRCVSSGMRSILINPPIVSTISAANHIQPTTTYNVDSNIELAQFRGTNNKIDPISEYVSTPQIIPVNPSNTCGVVPLASTDGTMTTLSNTNQDMQSHYTINVLPNEVDEIYKNYARNDFDLLHNSRSNMVTTVYEVHKSDVSPQSTVYEIELKLQQPM